MTFIKSRTLVGVAIVLSLAACAPNYSTGERSGVVTKLSHKGIIFKSWEGQLLMALPASTGTVVPEKFYFNVSPAALPKVKAALSSGKRVTLVYRQWLIKPPTIDHNHVIVNVR